MFVSRSLFCISQVGDVKFGDLIGQDHHGNKYFENKDYPHGGDRKRGKAAEAFFKPDFNCCIEFSMWMYIVRNEI